MKYYSLKKILEYNATYNMIIGERSNGKTFACLEYALKRYVEHGERTAIVRRYLDDFRKKRASRMFESVIQAGVVEKITKGKYNNVWYDGTRWYLSKDYVDDKGRVQTNKDCDPFACGYAISAQEHDKGFSDDRITTIVFDEFLSRIGYLPEEFILFTNTLSSIIRNRGNVKIFMLGNTVNKYCPYFEEMGLKHVPKMKQGTIDLYRYGDTELTVAVEYCEKSNNSKPSDKYFAFDNPKLQMITNGVWEIAIYPHAPCKILPKDIVFSYFIKFGGETVQCDVVQKDDMNFTFIHTKTTELKKPLEDLIFSLDYSPYPNWRRNIRKPTDDITKRVAYYYVTDKIFYQNNEIGEIVRNYLETCKIT